MDIEQRIITAINTAVVKTDSLDTLQMVDEIMKIQEIKPFLRKKITDTIDSLLDADYDFPLFSAGAIAEKIMEIQNLIVEDQQSDKFFITEIINDLHRNGFVRGGKAHDMLHDLSAELRDGCRNHHPASKLKNSHALLCGAENW